MTLNRFSLMFVAAAAFLLLVAYISQYGFGLEPCHLCLLQRYPYMAVVVAGLVVILISRFSFSAARRIFWLIPLLLLLESGIAIYHTGVERGVFQGPVSCVGTTSAASSIDDLRAQILQAPVVACNRPAFVFLGLSMAAWNGIAAVFLTMLSLLALLQTGKKIPSKDASSKTGNQ
jgi:disulfide bond formation protein DsbB